MFLQKQKFKLSKNLKLGIEAPSSQVTLFKVSGVLFLIISLFLIRNIYKNLNTNVTGSSAAFQAAQPKVLGAFDQQSASDPLLTAKPATYIVKKGDTLFNIAQSEQINWVVIATLNSLRAPYSLKPNTILKLR